MNNILITGITGFVGSHLAEYALAQNTSVAGFDLRRGSLAAQYHLGEITDRAKLEDILRKTKPGVVFHLAGVIKSPDPESLYKTNLLGTVALFEAITKSRAYPLVVVASSSAVYGPKSGTEPISEEVELQPLTHYAVSKCAQEMAAFRYFSAEKLPVIILRMFNLLGPGQSPDLACSNFARQIALAETGGNAEISTGNLDSQRDFVDVRDAVRAFMLAAETGKPGQVYNVCSGKAIRIQSCLNEMVSMSTCQVKVRVDAGQVQSNDVPIQIGSAEKIRLAVGWEPKISLKQSLTDLLNDWRQKIKAE